MNRREASAKLVLVLVGAALIALTMGQLMPTTAGALPDPVVTFPDASLNTAMRAELGVTTTATIHASQLSTITNLNLESHDIRHLDGLQYCTGLQELSIGDNNVTTISVVASMTALQSLQAWENVELSDLSPLSGLKYLSQLYVEDDAVATLTPISGMTTLTVLYAGQTQLTDINGVKGLTNLVNLDLGYDDLTDVSAVSGLTKLQQLDLYDTQQVTDLTPLQNLHALTWLNVSQNQITSLGPISGLTNLQFLRASENHLTSLAPVSGMTDLQVLWAGDNDIPTCVPVSGLTNLVDLELNGNARLTDIGPLEGLHKLNTVSITGDAVWDLSPIEDLNAAHVGGYTKEIDCQNNWLDLTSGSPAKNVLDGLSSHGYTIKSTPQLAGPRFQGVIHSTSGAPVSGATIFLSSGPAAVSLSDGTWSIGLVPIFNQHITFSKWHYISSSTDMVLSGGDVSTHAIDGTITPDLVRPAIASKPAKTSLSATRKKGVASIKWEEHVTDSYGGVSGVWLTLQRTKDKKHWTNVYSGRTSAGGYITRKLAFTHAGKWYFRWVSTPTALDKQAFSAVQSVRIK